MTPRQRDALLAAASGAACLAFLLVSDATAALARPATVVAGGGAALSVEALFVAETPVVRWWTDPRVQVGSAVAFVAAAAVGFLVAGPWLLAAACWGLATYFALLSLLAAGVWTPEGSDG